MDILCRRRGRGGGCRQKCMGIPAEGAGGVGVPGKCLGIPTKAPAGGMPAEAHGHLPTEARVGWGRPKECAGISCRRNARVSPCRRRGWGMPAKNASVFPPQRCRQRTLPRGATYRPSEPLFVRGIYFYPSPVTTCLGSKIEASDAHCQHGHGPVCVTTRCPQNAGPSEERPSPPGRALRRGSLGPPVRRREKERVSSRVTRT